MLETVLDDKETIKTENSLPLVYFQPVAEIISLLSRHTLNSLNSIENLISAILNTASITTSLSFELTRSLLVACFSGASNLSRSNQILHPFLDHYSNISIATLNHGFSLGLLLTLSTFHLASSTVKISIHASASMIHLLDGLFGSTDTSRLIASFVNLARREIDLDGTSFKSVILLGSITKSLIAYVSLKYMLMKYSRQDAKLNRLVDGLIHEKVNQTSNTAKTDRKLVHSFNDLNDNRSILVNWYNENDGTVIEIQETGRDDGSDIDEIMSFSSNLRENMPLVDDSADVINGGLIFNGSINTKDSDFVSDSLNDFGDQNLKTRFNLKSLVSKFKKKLFVEKQVLESTSSPEICTSGSFNINVEKQGRSLLFESQTETKRTNGLIKRSSRIQLRPNINQKLNDSELPLPSKTSTNSQHTALLESFLKYIKLSTASYGHLMMSMIGLSKISHLDIRDTKHSAHHYNFSIHSGIPLNCILYSSQDKNNSINHTILLDHSIKSIVMVFRGSFGVGDVLVDLTCTYKKHILNNKEYLFHDGMLKSALELLDSESIRLIISQMNSLKYALVLCGHSLGIFA